MKKALAALAFAACAAPYAAQAFDFSEVPGAGIVEAVREVHLETDPFAGALVHRMRPELGDQLFVRLDDGRVVAVLQKGAERFEAGQRVRVVSDAHGTHLQCE